MTDKTQLTARKTAMHTNGEFVKGNEKYNRKKRFIRKFRLSNQRVGLVVLTFIVIIWFLLPESSDRSIEMTSNYVENKDDTEAYVWKGERFSYLIAKTGKFSRYISKETPLLVQSKEELPILKEEIAVLKEDIVELKEEFPIPKEELAEPEEELAEPEEFDLGESTELDIKTELPDAMAIHLQDLDDQKIVHLRRDFDIETYLLKGKWFQRSKKYLVYQPSGGLSNQRIEMENAMLVARILNRTLVVPPIAPHTSMFWNYNKVEWPRTVSPFDVFDRQWMESVVDVVAINNTILRRFVESNENKHNQKWHRIERPNSKSQRGSPWTAADVYMNFGEDDSDVLFFAKYTMWKCFDFMVEQAQYFENRLQLTRGLKNAARLIVERMFHGAPFNAIHVRFEDKGASLNSKLTSDALGPAKSFVHRLQKKNVVESSKILYVATHPGKTNSTYFDAFRSAGFELVFSDSIMRSPEAKSILSIYPQNDIQISILGLVEQLICARASYFLGSGFSTFSRYIRIKRSKPILYFDESLLEVLGTYRRTLKSAEILENFERALETQQQGSQLYDEIRREIQLIKRPIRCREDKDSMRVC